MVRGRSMVNVKQNRSITSSVVPTISRTTTKANSTGKHETGLKHTNTPA